jgi:hypothetical protein
MFRNSLTITLLLSFLCSTAFGAPLSDVTPEAALPVLTQDQAALYLACLEESGAANAKDGNPMAQLKKLNALWSKTVKHTSLKGLTLLQLAQVTESSLRAMAEQQFGNPHAINKVLKEFSVQSPTGCLSLAQSLQQ